MLQFQIDGFVDPVDKLVHRGIDSLEDCGLLINLELELRQQVLVKRILRHLDLVEKFHDFFLTSVGGLILLLGLLDDLIGKFTVTTHELIGHLLELLLLCFKFLVHFLITVLSLHDYLSEEKASVNVRFLQPAERFVSWLEFDKLRDIRLTL